MYKPQAVTDAVVDALKHLGNASRGATKEALASNRTLFDCRENLCTLFNGENSSQIAFTCNVTESLNIAVKGTLAPGDKVVTTVMEHNSVLRPIYEMVDRGVEETLVPTHADGTLDMAAMKEAITPGTKAVVVTHAANLTGIVNPIKEIADLAHAAGALLIVDAAQTAGAIPIDVQAMGIDILCFTGHKSLMGPQGTGGLYVRPGVEVRPLKSGGTGVDTYNHHQPEPMPTRLEAGTANGHGIAGLNAAVKYLLDYGVDKIEAEERQLTDYFYQGVKDIPGLILYGRYDTDPHAPIVTLNIADVDSGEVADELNEGYDIQVRAGGHCAPLMHEALGTKAQGAVRFSFSHYTTREELDTAIQALKAIASDLLA